MTQLSRQLSEAGGDFSFVETTIVLPAAQTWKTLALPNSLRWGLIIGLVDANSSPVRASTRPGLAAAAANGLIISSTSPPLLLTYADFGGLVCQGWFGSAASAILVDVTVIEILAVTGGDQ